MTTADDAGGSRAQLRQPRLSEIVASELRDRILSGSLGEEGRLPKQDELIAEFGVSPPSVREAMRILETEGLITVLRGNVGGAVARLPTPRRVAYHTGLVLHVRHTPLGDVGDTIARLEPLCARLCAQRADREHAVLPALDVAIDAQRAVIDEPDRFHERARSFHEAVVDSCGNETLALILGSLETLWSAHSADWLQRAEGAGGEKPTVDGIRAALTAHEKLRDAIAAGDADRAVTIAGRHVAATQAFTLRVERDRMIDADLAR